ncbi:hypothetical protein JCM1406_01080 [Clostridium novyi]
MKKNKKVYNKQYEKMFRDNQYKVLVLVIPILFKVIYNGYFGRKNKYKNI